MALRLIALVTAFFSTILLCHVLNVAWGWFITPTFGVAAPGILILLALRVMVFAVSYRGGGSMRQRIEDDQFNKRLKNEPALAAAAEQEIVSLAIETALFPLLMWGLLYIYTMFM